MACALFIQNIADVLVEWDVPGIGEITGFGDGSDSISIEWADEGKNTLKSAADGTTGTMSASNRTNGMVKLKLNPGSPFVHALRQVWQNNRTLSGVMSIVNTATGEAHILECAFMEFVPAAMQGAEAPEDYEFPFLFLRSTSTPSVAAAAVTVTF